MQITSGDFDAIWLDVDPPAREAFNRLVRDHGWRFAKLAKDHILACKLIAMNEDAIKSGLQAIEPWWQPSHSSSKGDEK